MITMRAPAGAPDWLAAFTAEERPDLWTKAGDEGVFNGVWPEYHGNLTGQYFGTLFRQHPHLQVLFTDQRSGRVIGRGRTIPFRWDGELALLTVDGGVGTYWEPNIWMRHEVR